jgi:hypothetical protein
VDGVGYSGRALPQKLGIKPGATVVLVDAPEGAEALLSPLPDWVTLRRGNRGQREMTIWFVTARREMERRFDAVAKAVGETWSGLRLTRRRTPPS